MQEGQEQKIRVLEEKIKNLELFVTRFENQVKSFREELEELKQETPSVSSSVDYALDHVVENILQKRQQEEEARKQQQREPKEKEARMEREREKEIQPKKEPLEDYQQPAAAFSDSSEATKNDAVPETETAPVDVEPFNIENYIGGNILSKLGILILIIGLGVFVKYAIDHELISPLGRLFLAYAAGGGLIGLSYYLKAKYHRYSAVLFSGGAATLYFTTYIGYGFLDILPQWFTFLFMLLCTAYTVYQSTVYDEEIIGMIGLVGAYSVPPLIGNKGGNIAIFFIYMSIINTGVLTLAFRKSWQRLNLVAFGVSWLIFVFWFQTSYVQTDLWMAFAFNFVFFAIFQVTLLIHYVYQPEEFQEIKAGLLFVNSLVFYFLGTAALQHSNPYFFWTDIVMGFQHTGWRQGSFTFLHSVLSFVAGYYVIWKKQEDRWVYLPALALGTYMLTFAILVTFQGVWIPVLWTVETVLFFALVQHPVWKNKVYQGVSLVLPYLIAGSLPLVLDRHGMLAGWTLEAAVLFTASKVWKEKSYNTLALCLSVIIALGIPGTFSGLWMIFWWAIEAAVLFSIAKGWKDIKYDIVTLGILVLIALKIPYLWEGYAIPVGWTLETAVVFALVQLFPDKHRWYESLSAVLASLTGVGVWMVLDGESVIWWWLLESVLVFVLGRVFRSIYFEYISQLLLGCAVIHMLGLWGTDYIHSKVIFSFVFNGIFLVSVAVIAEVVSLGYIYARYRKAPSESGMVFPEENLSYFLGFLAMVLIYVLFFLEIYHYFIARTPYTVELLNIALFFYSIVYVILLTGVARWWLPLRPFGQVLVVLNALLMLLFVTLGFWSLDNIHVAHPDSGYVWIRWGGYALMGILLRAMYSLIQHHKIVEKKYYSTLYIILHVFCIMLLSFELMSLVILYSGMAIEVVRPGVAKLGFTLLWGGYSVGLIVYGIIQKRKYLRLTGFALLGVTLCKLFIHDIRYNSTFNVMLAFISIGVLLLVIAFLYQKYKEIILGEDEPDRDEHISS